MTREHMNSKQAGSPKKKDTRKEKGKAGEVAAMQYLQKKGYRIVETNWKCRSGELDIIAEIDGTYVFTEVRSRTPSDRFGTHLESVNHRKIAQVRRTAAVYIQEHKLYNSPIRFDVIGVLLDHVDWSQKPLNIDHVIHAF
ncbi:YraN family protein [Neobacillus mesonae]|nr:YraN family protein [Neobacillus mesonae]